MVESRQTQALPLILAGPILRKVTPTEVVLWFATAKPCQLAPYFSTDGAFRQPIAQQLNSQCIRLAQSCYIYLLHCQFDTPLPTEQIIHYDVAVTVQDSFAQDSLLQDNATQHFDSLKPLVEGLYYDNQQSLSFFIPEAISSLLFGSCRNIHHGSKDAMVTADKHVADNLLSVETRPCILLHGGDQVYVDDVAGPTLKGIHHLVDILGFSKEHLPDEHTTGCEKVHHNDDIFYTRQSILPQVTFNSRRLLSRLLPFRRTMPVFSSVKADNHLITLAEMFGLYLLTWSPEPWDIVGDVIKDKPANLTPAQNTKFAAEMAAIENFITGLTRVRRLMAHIPNYMIFDDHDVTDDWNLTAQWEDNVYTNPFSKRVISNALVAYWVFQGWGNAPEHFDESWLKGVQNVCDRDDVDMAETLEKQIFAFNRWHFSIELEPNVIVLDTRTHRWRSERSQKNPSGLMDWERLVELEDILENKEAGIILSPAPIFGVKLIETIQRVFTFFGCELMVDAENWMAHKGSATKLLQIFARVDTPDEIVVLSGDVHYSFCFKVQQRFGNNDTDIWQLTSSGMKNEFPPKLLDFFDRFERLLYFAASPINIFTKRRRLEVKQQHLKRRKNQILYTKSNIGLVEFEQNKLKSFTILVAEDDVERFL